jgi:N-acetylglucosaminyldiphosphoundecaprenol N-acetyl-beta-D-mannosaminyltransferase
MSSPIAVEPGGARPPIAVERRGEAAPAGSRQRLMGMPLDGLTLEQAVERVFAGLRNGRGGAVFTPNIDILRRHCQSPSLQRVFEKTELLVPDGMPLVWACRLQRRPVPRRITGTDMVWALSEAAAERGAAVFLAGGHPGVARRAAERLAYAYPALRVSAHPCYIRPGALDDQLEDLVETLVAAAPDLVFLGLPFQPQADAIETLRLQMPQTWFVGVGSTFDLITGDRPRAPEWLQRLGLEWAHRVVHEPRVWRRYLLQGLPFAVRLGLHVLKERMRHRRPPAMAPAISTKHVPEP